MYDLFDNEIVGISIEEICFLWRVAICIPLDLVLSSTVTVSYVHYKLPECYQANTISHVPCILGAPTKLFLRKISLVVCDYLLVLFTDITLGLMNHHTPVITCGLEEHLIIQ